MAAAAPAPVTREVLESQLRGLGHARTRAGAVGTLLLLLGRGVDDELLPLLAPHVPALAGLLADGGGAAETDPTVQANAAAVLGAAASLSDDLNKAVDAAAVGRRRIACALAVLRARCRVVCAPAPHRAHVAGAPRRPTRSGGCCAAAAPRPRHAPRPADPQAARPRAAAARAARPRRRAPARAAATRCR